MLRPENIFQTSDTSELSGKHVLFVGFGVVNAICALAISRLGARVTVLDRSPDPRSGGAWDSYGASRGGMAARMFTYTEADQYRSLSQQNRFAPSSSVFDRRPSEGGWDIRSDRGRPEDGQWTRTHMEVSPEQATRLEKKILQFNMEAAPLWEHILGSLPVSEQLSYRPEILRLYDESDDLERAEQRHIKLSSLLATVRPEDLEDRIPMVTPKTTTRLAGALITRGFTLDVHYLMALVADELEASGSSLRFSVDVTEACTDSRHGFLGVIADDSFVTADYVICSPGVYGEKFLASTGVQVPLAGVAGLWHDVPNVYGQNASLKIHRRSAVAQDANITVQGEGAASRLIFGAGYGFVGTDPRNIDKKSLQAIRSDLDDLVRTLAPEAYEAAGGRSWLAEESRFCIRPWTPSGLGLFSVSPGSKSQLVITGGNNTGGFAQAPSIAAAVVAFVNGQHHPMHNRADANGQGWESTPWVQHNLSSLGLAV
ncbi:FAD-dependent oxidoreductase [Arthrobacter sp. ISL-48]|uniref:FAD-binding oxidoreductase n=1 Tax=Arthrobacter sp. ISL-48 TaxID=2819110 RepID=UPI001BE8410C|nr:FAD-dependent oxidoreductase [Arthrobacter sp. ISL-48]MBT2531248.1 FAD-dependent oxidoreductase [Arthrobacter sp. ISL-48]